jgi:hypothetical protein
MLDEALEKSVDLVVRLWHMIPEGSSSHAVRPVQTVPVWT